MKEILRMTIYEKSLNVLEELFAKDYQFALATSNDNVPTVRFVDTFYDNGAFYIVSYAKSQKVKDIEKNLKYQCAINFIDLAELPVI